MFTAFYKQVFLSKHRMRPIKLTNSPFSHSGTKTLDRFGNTFPVQKIKITPPFVSKGKG
jgi:hypothetical protein